MKKIIFADNTELEVLDSSSANVIQFTYNAQTFSDDIVKFTDTNINGAQLQILQTVEDVEEVTETTLIQAKKVNNSKTISSNVVTVSLHNMNTTEQKILQLQQQNVEVMSAVDALLGMILI